VEALAKAGASTLVFSITGEPSIEDVTRGLECARSATCDMVIGFGGGSVLDAAKAIAGLLTNEGEIFEYLEVIGRGRPLARPAAPCIAVPTTAGTGSEVTRNAVLSSALHRVKVSLRSPHLLPRIALVDPELTYHLPPSITAATGLDALTQLIEPFVSSRPNPLTDALCREGIQRAARSLQRAVENGHDVPAREDMCVASLLGGLALANAGLGAVHGLAAPIGGSFHAPHGAVCAALLPQVIETNLTALRARAPTDPALGRYDEVARIVTGHEYATARDLTPWVHALVLALKIPRLATYGIATTDFAALAKAGSVSSSMKANPVALTDSELIEILSSSL
jgi:alcohol dehydrogenase class IV